MRRSISMEDSADVSPIKQTCIIPRNRSYFPSDVLKYMKIDAKPKMSLKLMQVCKYFKHREFPYFVVKSMNYFFGEWTYTTLHGKHVKKRSVDEFDRNLWITGSIFHYMGNIDYRAFVNKVIACDAEQMTFTSQKIPFNDIKPLCENVKFFFSYRSILYGEDNENDISLEGLLESMPKLETLFLDFGVPSIVSLDRLNRVITPKLKKILISNFQETFNFGTFVDFLLQHQNIQFLIQISLQDLSPEYFFQMRMHISRIISGWNCQYRPPTINYTGLLQQNPLKELHYRYIHTPSNQRK